MRNLTEVSLKNRMLVWYFIFMTAIGGVFSYLNLGRMEDPIFTISLKDKVVAAGVHKLREGQEVRILGAAQ